MKKGAVWALVVLLAALAAWFALAWRGAERRAEKAQRVSVQPVYNRVLLDEIELAELKERGLEDPIPALKADLSSRKDLIKFDSGVGGTMAFYDKDGMVFLPGGYVYAPAEDGHYLMHVLLSYEVAPGGKITWKVVSAKRD
ncbi:MAG TPA: hypothetical protein VFX78_14480 [Candidatus Eisenbacteria bacterium]|jgi:hypothetical protein|nr:hypothetical protein [Candidatus Eisenbacteria bacterium]